MEEEEGVPRLESTAVAGACGDAWGAHGGGERRVETRRVCEPFNARLRGEGERERRSEREPQRGAVSSLSDLLREESSSVEEG